MDITQEINTVEWFFGYGGNHIGLKRVLPNLRLRAVCEIEEFAIENILAKMESGFLEATPIWSNCKTFPTQPFVDRVDLFIASYPCQPFSSAGKRQGENDERHLWPSVYMWIRATRPLCVFLENVEGHVSMGLSTVISDLEEAGYETSWGIFSARECLDGNNETATHQRKRVFIMAHLKDNELEVNNGSKIQCETSGKWTLQPWGIRSCNGTTILWPSRPGQPQHGWEPPRVVGSVPTKLANFCSRDSQQGRDTAQTGGQSVGAWQESEDAMPHSRSSVCGGDQGDEQAMANSNGSEQGEERGDDGEVSEISSEKWSDQCSTLFGGESAAMGNAEHDGLLTKPVIRRDEAASDERTTEEPQQARQLAGADRPVDVPSIQGRSSGSKSVGNSTEQGCEGGRGENDERGAIFRFSKPDGSSSDRPMESGQRQTEPPLGGDADGPSIGLDLPSMPTISDSELVEIFDWMVKSESRVDELRLLGNGVFPSTAEKAFRTLFKELIERSI